MLCLVFQNGSDELVELFVSYIFETIAILEVFISPFDQVHISCQVLAFLWWIRLWVFLVLLSVIHLLLSLWWLYGFKFWQTSKQSLFRWYFSRSSYLRCSRALGLFSRISLLWLFFRSVNLADVLFLGIGFRRDRSNTIFYTLLLQVLLFISIFGSFTHVNVINVSDGTFDSHQLFDLSTFVEFVQKLGNDRERGMIFSKPLSWLLWTPFRALLKVPLYELIHVVLLFVAGGPWCSSSTILFTIEHVCHIGQIEVVELFVCRDVVLTVIQLTILTSFELLGILKAL